MRAASRWAVLFAAIALVHRAGAQDPITLGVRGSSAAQPGLVVLAGPGLDSVRTVVQRDLMNSDRFTMAPLTDSAGTLRAPLDPAALKNIPGLTWAVELQPAINGVEVKLYDVASGTIRHQEARPADLTGVGDTRITIHRVSDLIVSWTGGIGIAASRIAFKWHNGKDDAIWRIDSDGANLARVTQSGIYMTPAWSPDNGTIAYSKNADGVWTLFLQRLATGTRTAVTSSSPGSSYGANFSPDGKSVVLTHQLPAGGAAIETVDVARNCCAHTLTPDRRNADNVSPSYSHDGRHIAYISNRTGTPQIYVMDNDGALSEQLVASEFGESGRALDSYSPVWSPDGVRIVFGRDLGSAGGKQIFTASVAGGQVVRQTAGTSNEDPSWAPDSRHVVFKSRRSGREQLWILDIESATFRQLTNVAGGAQYPAWSHSFGTNP